MSDLRPLDPPPSATLAAATGALPGDLRPALDRLQQLAFRSVQLDARARELRPSTLSASGRRDVLATLRRRELHLVGLDCLIPPRDLTDPRTADATVTGVIEVIRLAADLGRVPLAMRLPSTAGSGASADAAGAAGKDAASTGSPLLVTGGNLDVQVAVASMEAAGTASSSASSSSAGADADASVDPATIAFLAAAADRHGVTLVDHAVPPRSPAGPLVPGLDVAACLAAGANPMLLLATAGDRLGGVRLSDLTDDGRRVPLGHPEGRLGLEAFAAAMAAGGPVPRILDVRQCGDGWDALVAGARAWTAVTP